MTKMLRYCWGCFQTFPLRLMEAHLCSFLLAHFKCWNSSGWGYGLYSIYTLFPCLKTSTPDGVSGWLLRLSIWLLISAGVLNSGSSLGPCLTKNKANKTKHLTTEDSLSLPIAIWSGWALLGLQTHQSHPPAHLWCFWPQWLSNKFLDPPDFPAWGSTHILPWFALHLRRKSSVNFVREGPHHHFLSQ